MATRAPTGPFASFALSSSPPPSCPAVPLYLKSVTFSTEAMFTRSLYATPDIAAQNAILTTVARYVDEGKIALTVAKNLGHITAANLARGHLELEAGHVVGKLVLAGW